MILTETIDIIHLNVPNAYQVVENEMQEGGNSFIENGAENLVVIFKL